jgi:hypothetical protein
MEELQRQNKGAHLKTIERFHIYSEYTNDNHLNDNTGQQISKKNFVSVMNMLLIYLFASMKLKRDIKNLLGSSFKILLPL